MEIVMNNSAVMENKVNNGVMVGVRTDATPVAWKAISGCRNFQNPVTIEEAVKEVGADYEVQKEHLVKVPQSLIDSIMSGNPHVGLTLTKDDIIQSHMATVRKDNNKTLGVVGSNYGVVQNSKAFEFIDIITSGKLGGNRPVIETAGVLGDGERMYVTAKMPTDLYIGDNKKDPINDYILFTNSHDGSGAVTVLFTPIRVICQNMLNMVFSQARNKLVFRHSSRVNERLEWEKEENIERAVAVLKMHEKFKKEFIDRLFQLSKVTVTDKDAINFAANIFAKPEQVKQLAEVNYNLDAVEDLSTRVKNNIVALRDAIESGVGQEDYRGSKLWLFNGLTTFFSNERKFKNTEDKLNSIVDGDAYKKVQKGFDLLYKAA